VTTVPALNATFPALNKREPTHATELLKRATITTLPSFAKSCTEIATALSSGCSCLLGSNAAVRFPIHPLSPPFPFHSPPNITSHHSARLTLSPVQTTTTTSTSTSTLPLPQKCSSQNSYGLYPTPLTFTSLPNGQGSSGLGFEVWPGGCCAYCLASPNCIAYYEIVDYVATVPGKVGCSVDILGGEPIEPLGVPSCPLGTVTLTAGPVETSILYGNGACGTVVSV
jgi:hypothetical protein